MQLEGAHHTGQRDQQQVREVPVHRVRSHPHALGLADDALPRVPLNSCVEQTHRAVEGDEVTEGQ